MLLPSRCTFCSSVLGVVAVLAVLLEQVLRALGVPEVEALASGSLCSRGRKCSLHTPQALCLSASALVVQQALA